MRLQFKHQKFQADVAKIVCDVFAGQFTFHGQTVAEVVYNRAAARKNIWV